MKVSPAVKQGTYWALRVLLVPVFLYLPHWLANGRLPLANPLHWAVLVALGVVGGALGALGVSRLAAGRAMGADRSEGIVAGIWLAYIASVVTASSGQDGMPLLTPSRMFLAILTGLVVGAMGCRALATYAFALAVFRLRRGDREGARKAIREYLKTSEQDPLCETRRPIAERFLQDESATLDIPVELEAAAPPEGRGTEPEGASPPAGRGTELEGAPHGRP